MSALELGKDKRPSRILLVDDEPFNLAALEACLEPLGHEIFSADTGKKALELFERLEPDLLIIDMVMPDLDGLQLLRHVRSHPSRGATPVILMTGHSERERRLRGLEAGADDYLEKPLDAAVLLARTETLLRLKESRDELQASRDALAEQNRELERSHREQRELTEFIVHDLKGPLTGIFANTEWVYEQIAHTETANLRALEDVLSSAGRLRDMIGDLMAVSQMEAGLFAITRKRVMLGAMLRKVTRSFARVAEQKRISLPEPPELPVAAEIDVGLMERVLANILENSLRYTPERGKVAVLLHVNGNINIEVANSGPAIPEAERLLIFEKFTRGSNAGLQAGNAGLGLYFCKRAVEAHGGRIQVVERAEYPTCFLIQLPATMCTA